MTSHNLLSIAARRMAAALLLLLTVLQPVASHGQAFAPPDPAAIKLVLLVAVDQFRYDYLPRYRSEFSSGLATLLERGAVFSDAHLEHGTTVTAVGHATMLSGALPAVSGIISNGWYDRSIRGAVTSVNDPSVQLLGAPGEASSPHRLLVTTVGDELKIAARSPSAPKPRTVGVSMKDRSAILPAGRMADAAYWFDNHTGQFVTSSYYMPATPAWVDEFNARRLPDSYAGKRWTFDGPDGGRDYPTETGQRLNEALYASPVGNELLLAFATQALAREQLGQRGVTDVLTVSFSSNDAVGHRYGPDSPEVTDMIRRTDATVGALFAEVDRLVGLNHTLVVFTTDHGVAPLPETAAGWRLPGGRFPGATLTAAIQNALEETFGKGAWVVSSGNSVYLDHALIASRDLDPARVRRVAADAAATVPHVARVFTREELLAGVPNDRVSQRVARSYHATRSGDLEIVLEPYWIRGATGATHGSPYNYDSHIPVILMGPGVQRGMYHGHVALNDVAPTLSALLGIEAPSGSSGRVLVEALSRQTVPAPVLTR